jgi:hypothetical protein
LTKIKVENSSRAGEIDRYEEEMMKRGKEEAEMSVKTALTVHNWELLLDSPLMKHGVTKMS